MALVLAIDQGSSSTKVVVVDAALRVLARGRSPVGVTFPRAGWVEFDPEQLWRSTQLAVAEALSQLRGAAEIAAVGISNQRESVVLWDRGTGTPLGPGVSWRCQRGAEHCEAVGRSLGADVARSVTGLPLDTAYSAPKLAWLLDHADRSAGAAAGTVDAWLTWKLTGGAVHACDAGNASRTALLDLATGRWSSVLLDAYRIPAGILPEVVPTSGALGTCTALPGLEGVPLCALAADSHAALFTHYLGNPSAMKASYGTGSSVVTRQPGQPEPGDAPGADGRRRVDPSLAHSILWKISEPQLGVEGNVLATGSSLDWMSTILGLESFAQLERLASETGTSKCVSVVPALTGLGAPWLEPRARAVIDGLSLTSCPGNLAYGAFEGVAHLVADVVEAIAAEVGFVPPILWADGGVSRSALLMQLQADLLGLPVHRSGEQEASATGAAALAGLGAGLWAFEELSRSVPPSQVFEPTIAPDERAERRGRWRAALLRCTGAVS